MQEKFVSFENDYNNGAHPKVLEALFKTNLEPLSGYGDDRYCDSAKEKIRAAIGMPDAEIFFLVGGTQTNSVVIASLLQEYEGAVAATSGHIAVHEAGAVEGSGHKILELPEHNGKIDPAELRAYISKFYRDDNHTHMVYPGLVYISHPTEFGTLYSKSELTELHEICTEYKIPLFLDGARLASGLASPETDVTIRDIAQLTDVFYIGGTKCGALCGEAVVFTKHNMPKHFLTVVKRHGALMAKGRLLGVQFDALFTDGLYFEIGKHAMDKALKLKEIFAEAGCRIYMESPTNQQFIVLPNDKLEKLREKAAFSYWDEFDADHTAVRFVTSWATTDEDLEVLRETLKEL